MLVGSCKILTRRGLVHLKELHEGRGEWVDLFTPNGFRKDYRVYRQGEIPRMNNIMVNEKEYIWCTPSQYFVTNLGQPIMSHNIKIGTSLMTRDGDRAIVTNKSSYRKPEPLWGYGVRFGPELEYDKPEDSTYYIGDMKILTFST